MTEREYPVRPRSCPRCGAPASVFRNPYFGVGLAVHSHLWICTRCEFFQLLRLQGPESDRDAGEPARLDTFRGIGGEFRRLWRFGRG